jgi:altronate hydrolase
VQSSGGTRGTVKRGLELVEELLGLAAVAQREPCSAADLVLGVKCGGSDGFSGLSCNPALGAASDLVVRSGGTALITEIPEFCGAEHVIAMRARAADVGKKVFAAVDWFKAYAARVGSTLGQNPSPGNREGGLLNITVKSLGAVAKGGTTRVEDVIGYAERVERRGLVVMQGPGYDQESTPGLVGAGANVLVFTTGRGTTIGNAICPVIKLASNTSIFERMRGDLDLNAGTVIDGTESIEEVGRRVFEHVVSVAGGLPARAEENGHREFQFWPEESVSL